MKLIYLLLVAALFMFGCTSRSTFSEEGASKGRVAENSYTSYASGFHIYDNGSYTLLEVSDPWQQSQHVIFSYILAPEGSTLPDSLDDLPTIRTPVQRVITLSTTHVAMIDQLGCAGSIVGLSGSKFIYGAAIRERIESGLVEDVGYGQGLDYESVVRLNPDLVFLYGVEGNVMTTLEKLSELGIPAVFCGEYLESHPLGKAEWIRFFSLFYEKEAVAASIFNGIDSAYLALSALTAGLSSRPRILNGLPWKDTWYMAGGKSFAAKLIEDAGGDYLWKDNASTQALPLDLESVYLRGVNADIWINPGAAESLEDIIALDPRFGELAVYKRGQVYNNDARLNAAGGNDYWESATVRPDLVLADLIGVFHPRLLPDHPFVYYRQLK